MAEMVRVGLVADDVWRGGPDARFFFRDPDGYVFEVVEAERRPET